MPTAELTKKPEAKYQTFADGLRQRIQCGELKPGDRLPSLSEMCEQHNVSRSTVERVHQMLELDGLVIREHGRGTFVANRAKRNNGFIGFTGYAFEATLHPPYWSQCIEGFRHAASRVGESIVLVDRETFSDWDRVDGLVFTDPPENIPADMPQIMILTESVVHPCVVANEYQGGQLATQHLLDLGHRRIATLMNKDKEPTNRRFAAYLNAMTAAGCSFDERWTRNYHGVEDIKYDDFVGRGRTVMREWLSQDWHELGCTALIVQNDLVAAGVLEALREAGISVPGQVSVVGYDSLAVCDVMSPRLTSVAVPLREIAATAMDLLLLQIQFGPRTPSTTVLPVSLEIRESTAPPAAA